MGNIPLHAKAVPRLDAGAQTSNSSISDPWSDLTEEQKEQLSSTHFSIRITDKGRFRLHPDWTPSVPRTVNGTGHTGPSEFCATSIYRLFRGTPFV